MQIVTRELPMSNTPPLLPQQDLDLSVLSGIVADMRTQAGFLIKCLNNNRQIDPDLWHALADVAGDLMNSTDELLCIDCLAEQKVKLGRGNGFDGTLCDRHARDMRGDR